MPHLLFELGCEELPASSIRRAAAQLESEIVKRLDAASVPRGASRSLGTPRRLIVGVDDVAAQQPDLPREQRGPAVKAAFDADGKPTKALEGFCRGQGVDPSAVEVEGDYVWVRQTVPGRPTREILAEALEAAVRAVSFDKTMRWAHGRFRFARPIRWMLACFGGELVQVEIEGVSSGLKSRGHRFNHPGEFEARSFEELLVELRARDVEPDPAERERLIREGAHRAATGEPVMSAALVEENVFLGEWPTPLEGEFPAEYLELPEPVLVTVMAKHERFFPVRGADGRLTNRFVSVRNGGQEADVRKGNQWVLNARFNDARFFFEEDKKALLDDFLARTEAMSFQVKLGSVRRRCDRLEHLARSVAEWSGADESEASLAAEAGLYAKADLATGLVSELDELQGQVGAEYARRESRSDAVCAALAGQYGLGPWESPTTAGDRTALRLVMADHLDKLAGYLGLGFAPSGSSDPYGLRRSVTVLIEVAWAWGGRIPGFEPVFEAALAGYAGQGVELDAEKARASLAEVFAGRYESLLASHRYDLVQAACLPGALLTPREVLTRLRALEKACADPAFVQTATRPSNILAAAAKNGVDFDGWDRSRLGSAEAEALLAAAEAQLPLTRSALAAEDPAGLVGAVLPLVSVVNAFFDATMVMVEDTAVRDARLGALGVARQAFETIGDFTKVVVEGR